MSSPSLTLNNLAGRHDDPHSAETTEAPHQGDGADECPEADSSSQSGSLHGAVLGKGLNLARGTKEFHFILFLSEPYYAPRTVSGVVLLLPSMSMPDGWFLFSFQTLHRSVRFLPYTFTPNGLWLRRPLCHWLRSTADLVHAIKNQARMNRSCQATSPATLVESRVPAPVLPKHKQISLFFP